MFVCTVEIELQIPIDILIDIMIMIKIMIKIHIVILSSMIPNHVLRSNFLLASLTIGLFNYKYILFFYIL